MPNQFSGDALKQFHRDGFTPAIPVISRQQAIEYRIQLESIEATVGPLLGGRRLKCHLLYSWVADLIRTPSVYEPVREILGPDIMCWGTDLWVKEANSEKFVSWHQDSEYWGIDSDHLITAWVALSPATVESGCMRMLPGSHKQPGMQHTDTFQEDNLLTRGQTIFDVNEDMAVNIEVDTGEAVYFAYRIAHASHPNRSDDRRIGVAIRYITPEARQTKSDWDTATLICGEDRYGHFVQEPKPSVDFDLVAVEFHKKSNENYRQILYSGTDWESHRT